MAEIARYRRAALIAGVAIAVVGAGHISLAASSERTRIGAVPVDAGPSCAPKPKDCTVVGRVTGFQARAGQRSGAYAVPEKGQIVSWGLTLGKPGKWEEYFDRYFGGSAKARIASLRRVKPGRYRLLGQSDTVELEQFFGTSPAFQLSRPLHVRKGDVVALSILTWAPTFAVGLTSDFSWRADRSRAKCDPNRNKGIAHTRRGTERPYACTFNTARLLYHAEFVPDK